MLKQLLNLHDRFTNLTYALSGVAIASITVAYLYQVFMRYFFKTPSSWTGDLVSYLLIVMVCLALPKITQEKKHIAVTFLTDKLRGSPAKYTHIIANIIASVTCMALACYSIVENVHEVTNGINTMGNHPIPKGWLSVTITYGMFSTGLYFLRSVFEPVSISKSTSGEFVSSL